MAKKQKQTVPLELAKHSDSWTVEGHRGREGLMVGKGAGKFGGAQLLHRMPLHHPAPGVAGAVTSLHNPPPCITHLPASILGRKAGAPRATSQYVSDVEATSGQTRSGFFRCKPFLGLVSIITGSHSSAPLGEHEVTEYQTNPGSSSTEGKPGQTH